jgi:hypothetical protein
MTQRIRSLARPRLLVAGVLVALALGAGAAVAYLTFDGSGTALVQVGAAGDVTVSPGTPTAPLYPGGSGDVALVVDNPNAAAVHLPSLVLDTSRGAGGFAVDGDHAGCDASTLAFAPQDDGGAGWDVPAGAKLSLDLHDAISMGADAVGACQGATFGVYLKAGR